MEITAAKAARTAKWTRLNFKLVRDCRKRRGRRHAHEGVLRLSVAALASGDRTLRQVEAFGKSLNNAGRRHLGLKNKISDTCIYSLLARQTTDGLAEQLTEQVTQAFAAKVIGNDLFRCGVVAIDGKLIWSGDNENVPCARKSSAADDKNGPVYVMAQRACLVSSRARPVVHQRQIPADAGEADSFPAVFNHLVKSFGRSFEVVTYDAGGTSRSNAALVNEASKAYVFAIKGNQPSVHQVALSMLGSKDDQGDQSLTGYAGPKEKYQGNVDLREAFCVAIDGSRPDIDFAGARQLWRIRHTSIRAIKGTSVVDRQVSDRYFITNRVFSPKDALAIARLHWGIENGPNWTMDKIFGEDTVGAPCTKGHAVAVWSWLRLMAYNLAAFWRGKIKAAKGTTAEWEETLKILRCCFLLLSAGSSPMSV